MSQRTGKEALEPRTRAHPQTARAPAAAAVSPTTGAAVGRQRASMGCDCDCAAEDYGFFAEEGCGFDAAGWCDPGRHQLAASLVTTAALAAQDSTMSSWIWTSRSERANEYSAVSGRQQDGGSEIAGRLPPPLGPPLTPLRSALTTESPTTHYQHLSHEHALLLAYGFRRDPW